MFLKDSFFLFMTNEVETNIGTEIHTNEIWTQEFSMPKVDIEIASLFA